MLPKVGISNKFTSLESHSSSNSAFHAEATLHSLGKDVVYILRVAHLGTDPNL